MTPGLTSTAPLAALLALPVVLALAWRRRALAAACMRVVALVLVLLALAGPFVERARPSHGACVVAAVDVSASVGDGGVATAAAFLAPLLEAVDPDDLVAAVAFAGRARVIAPPAHRPPLESLLPSGGFDRDGLEPGETDLAAAAVRAEALCPSDRQAAIVLVTDGRETRGSLLAETTTPADGGTALFALVPPSAALPAARLRRLLVPTFAAAGAPVPLEAVVENHTAGRTSAVLQMVVDDAPPIALPLDLPPGPSVVALPLRTQEPGAALVETRLLLPAGTPQAPGGLAATLTVTAPLRVLVASDREAPVAAAALRLRDVDARVVPPSAIGSAAVDLDAYHAVVLDDPTRASFAAGGLVALADFVAAGGGLVVTGGPRTFGDPALVGSPLARVLPVELASQAPEPREREPIALELVIDRSNSMGTAAAPGGAEGEKMEYARRAALAVLAQLEPQDLVGAIAFDAQPHELGPLVEVASGRDPLATSIRTLAAGGGTDFRDALDLARRQLETVDRRVRHVILLTDGDTNRRTLDHYQVVDALARADVTVSTIRIGSDTANLELLDAIARATGGEFHHVENIRALPHLMLSDAREFLESGNGRAPARVRVAADSRILAGIAPRELPALTRWATTRAKPDAAVALVVDAGDRRDPVLATWQHGLGRVAAVPVDFQAGGARWPGWDGFGKLWTQLVRWTARRALPGDVHVEARSSGEATLVLVETGGEPADVPTLAVDGHAVVLARTGPRRFSARVPALTAGAHDAELRLGGVTARGRLRVPAATASDAERANATPDRALLERATRRTGGRVDPAPADVIAARPGVARARVPLGPLCLALALAAILADVALRRLAR